MHFNPVSGFGRKDVVEHLLQTGANVHARDDGGLIPLHNACSFGHAEVVSLLLCQGADPNARDNWNYTPLHEAAIKGKIDVCIGKDPMLVISKHRQLVNLHQAQTTGGLSWFIPDSPPDNRRSLDWNLLIISNLFDIKELKFWWILRHFFGPQQLMTETPWSSWRCCQASVNIIARGRLTLEEQMIRVDCVSQTFSYPDSFNPLLFFQI